MLFIPLCLVLIALFVLALVLYNLNRKKQDFKYTEQYLNKLYAYENTIRAQIEKFKTDHANSIDELIDKLNQFNTKIKATEQALHQKAEDFNTMLETFPAQLLVHLFHIKPLRV